MVSSKPTPQLLRQPRMRLRMYRSFSLSATVFSTEFGIAPAALEFYAGEADLLRRYQLGCCIRFAPLIDDYSEPDKYTPRLASPVCLENHESVFGNQPRRFIAADQSRKLPPLHRAPDRSADRIQAPPT